MPATLVASIYGMNFHAMPELDWVYTFPDGTTVPLGYLFAIGLMILFSAGTIWFFRDKKWLCFVEGRTVRPAALILQSHGLFQKPLDVPYGEYVSQTQV